MAEEYKEIIAVRVRHDMPWYSYVFEKEAKY